MIYTLTEIKERIAPIAAAYQLPAYLFGSYAKGQADDQSDIDLAVTVEGTESSGFDFFQLEDMVQAQFECPLDLLTLKTLNFQETLSTTN